MIFPVLDIEDKVQVNDKTRLSGANSFISKGDLAITVMTVTPGSGATPINIFNADANERYTDWQWGSWAFDLDSVFNKIDFEEAGVDYVATVAPASYTSYATLATAIETALNSAGASGTFTCAVDSSNKVTISSTSSFSILFQTGDNRFNALLPHLGFYDQVDSQSVTYLTGLPIEYGLRKVTLTVNNTTGPVSFDLYQKVFTEIGDNLFSSDAELSKHESDILKWVEPGRSSFKNVHRRVQDLILEYLAGEGYVTAEGLKFTKWDLVVKKDFRDWATYYALYLIFESNSNAVEDVFAIKASKYYAEMLRARKRYVSVDLDLDGKSDSDENLRLGTINLFQR